MEVSNPCNFLMNATSPLHFHWQICFCDCNKLFYICACFIYARARYNLDANISYQVFNCSSSIFLHFIRILHLSLPCIHLWCQDFWVNGVSFQDQFHELKEQNLVILTCLTYRVINDNVDTYWSINLQSKVEHCWTQT